MVSSALAKKKNILHDEHMYINSVGETNMDPFIQSSANGRFFDGEIHMVS